MPSCAIPKCENSKRNVKKNYSSFKVPTDESLREKWIAAIPYVNNLRSSQVICELHFPENCILRKWISYNKDGSIIAEVHIYIVALYLKNL